MPKPTWKELRYRRRPGPKPMDGTERPPQPVEPMVAMTVWLHKDQRLYLEARATAQGAGLGETLRDLVDDVMERDPNTEAYLLGKAPKGK